MGPAPALNSPEEYVHAPRSWTEKAYHNLIYFNEAEPGGHFAAWEQPRLFAEELRAGSGGVLPAGGWLAQLVILPSGSARYGTPAQTHAVPGHDNVRKTCQRMAADRTAERFRDNLTFAEVCADLNISRRTFSVNPNLLDLEGQILS